VRLFFLSRSIYKIRSTLCVFWVLFFFSSCPLQKIQPSNIEMWCSPNHKVDFFWTMNIGSIFNPQPFLVAGWTNPFEKYARQIGSFPQVRLTIKKYLKPPPTSRFFVHSTQKPWKILHRPTKYRNAYCLLLHDFLEIKFWLLDLKKGMTHIYIITYNYKWSSGQNMKLKTKLWWN